MEQETAAGYRVIRVPEVFKDRDGVAWGATVDIEQRIIFVSSIAPLDAQFSALSDAIEQLTKVMLYPPT